LNPVAGEHKVRPYPCAFAGKKENLTVDLGQINHLTPLFHSFCHSFCPGCGQAKKLSAPRKKKENNPAETTQK
jgi:hypothetical protein